MHSLWGRERSDRLSVPDRFSHGGETWSPMLDKKQLANHLSRSTRWVELMVRDQGMPAGWDQHGDRRLFNLPDVEEWLSRRSANRRPPKPDN